MAKKEKAAPAGAGLGTRRFLSDADCKAVAGRISDQLRRYPELKAAWDRSTPNTCVAQVIPIWGPDLETVKAKIERLFHPGEAAVILPNLTA